MFNPFRKRREPPGVIIGGTRIPWLRANAGIVVTGSAGSGKTHASRILQRQMVRQGCPMLCLCVKPDEAGELCALVESEGQAHRLIRVRPGDGNRLQLLDYMLKVEGGNAARAARMFITLSDIAMRSDPQQQGGEKFWRSYEEAAFFSGIDLAALAYPKPTIDQVYHILRDSPNTPEEGEHFLDKDAPTRKRNDCHAAVIAAQGKESRLTTRRIDRCIDFFCAEFSSIGYKARAGVLSTVNQTIARLTREPFFQSFCTETTLTPRRIEEENLIVVLDAPVLTYGIDGVLFQAAWAILMQEYCLGRDPSGRGVPTVLMRDECGYLVHPDWDAKVAMVARSQKLLQFDIFQDMDILMTCFGGSPKAEKEARAFMANHAVKLMFNQANPHTCEAQSKLFGDAKEVMVGGGGGKPRGTVDELLGVEAGGINWSEQYQPVIRPGDFASLDIGQCYMRITGDDTAYMLDLWEGR